MKGLHMVAFILLVVGGFNWGLYALTGWEIGALFGGMNSLVSKVIYLLVGLSAVWLAITHRKDCRICTGSMGMGV